MDLSIIGLGLGLGLGYYLLDREFDQRQLRVYRLIMAILATYFTHFAASLYYVIRPPDVDRRTSTLLNSFDTGPLNPRKYIVITISKIGS